LTRSNLKRVPQATNAAPDTAAGGTDTPAPAPNPIFSEFNRWSSEYLRAAGADARRELETKGEVLARTRRPALAELIESDPEQAIAEAVPVTVRQRLPASISRHLEGRVSARARYEVLAAYGNPDDVRQEPTIARRATIKDRTYRAFVYGRRLEQTTKENIALRGIAVDDALAVLESPVRVLEPGELPDSSMPVANRDGLCPVSREASASGVMVEAGGELFHLCRAGHIAAFSEALEQEPVETGRSGSGVSKAAGAFSGSRGLKRVLLIRVNFPDAPAESISEAVAEDLMRKANDFFVENSYGATSLSATVTPLLTLPYPGSWYSANKADAALLSDARSAAVAAGYDPAGYELDCVHFRVAGFPNQAFVGRKGAWLQTLDVGTCCHELGHNLGLMHANAWLTSDGSTIGAGRNMEYGNVFDTMGGGSQEAYHFNACHKYKLGWLPDTAIQTVTSDGVYRLYPFDTGTLSNGLSYALRIRRDDQREFWIETRQQLNARSWSRPSLLVHWGPWNLSNGGSQLLDMTPASDGGRYDAPLLLGQSFYDASQGLKITPWRLGGTTPESIDVVVTHVHHIDIEAESGTLTSPMQIVGDGRASQGRCIWSSAADQGEASFLVDVPTDGSYVVWCRIAKSIVGQRAFVVSMDEATPELTPVSPGPASDGWRWARLMQPAPASVSAANTVPRIFGLAAGSHVMRVRAASLGTKLDSLFITNDPAADAPPSPPRLSARREVNGRATITVKGGAGGTFAIQATSDLATWVEVGTVTNTTGTIQITDTAASQFAYRFYQAVAK